jgi:hypothetical protein
MTIINNASAGSGSLNDGISISTSNLLTSLTPTITSAGAGEVAANISSPDHSLNYTSSAAAVYFSVAYGATQSISYVGVSGHTGANNLGVTIELYDDTTLIDSVTMTRNHNAMFTFADQTFTNLIVKFVTANTTDQVTLSFIAAGEHIRIVEGEQAGYTRNWLLRSTTDRVTTNLLTAPVSSTQQKSSLKGVLSIPNLTAVFTESSWQNFIDFSYKQPFFIKEVSSKPQSTYICFNPSHSVKAHPQTRLLNSVTAAFTAYNGL